MNQQVIQGFKPDQKQSDKNIQVLFDTFEGQVLSQRYKIGKFLDAGNVGKVFRVTDLKNPKSRPLVIKVQKKSKLFFQEVITIKKIQR